MSRHAWEVEQSLYRGSDGAASLQHLTTLSKAQGKPSGEHCANCFIYCRQNKEPQMCGSLPSPVSREYCPCHMLGTFLIMHRLLPGSGAGGEAGGRVEEGGGEREDGDDCGERGVEEGVPALPLQLMQRNRLSVDQIRQLPRFKNYSPGKPSCVRPHPLHLTGEDVNEYGN